MRVTTLVLAALLLVAVPLTAGADTVKYTFTGRFQDTDANGAWRDLPFQGWHSYDTSLIPADNDPDDDVANHLSFTTPWMDWSLTVSGVGTFDGVPIQPGGERVGGGVELLPRLLDGLRF